jgi:transketolase
MANEKTAADIDELAINTLRFLAVDAVEKANSGHPGMPMGDAAMAYALWTKFLRHNPKNPGWMGRDRFVLSAGHGSMLLYSLLHLTGYDITIDDLKGFRQWGSKTPGHPEYDIEIGVETTTGPLGQGFATGVGMAMAERYLANRFNRPGYPIFDYNVYAITSDGDMMEGVSNEAASLAGHLGLGKIIYLYSDNRITIEGSTDLSFTEDVGKRFDSLGWHVEKVDGNDLDAVESALEASRNETRRPSLIVARTHIGFGSPNKNSTAEAHGAPLGKDEVRLSKEALGWPIEPAFHVPDEVRARMTGRAVTKGAEREKEWLEMYANYKKEYPELAAELEAMEKKPGDWVGALPSFKPADAAIATRSASGKVLNAIASKAPFLIGGSADLSPSNNTFLKGLGEFSREHAGRNIHFGVREHAMGAIMNGMALSGLIVPYGGTFLVFSDYMRPAIRLAALMRAHVVYVFTHDSIGLGEDGPTHQPIEHLAALRAMPNLTVIRPADASETVSAWKSALTRSKGPTALVLTRQNLPVIDTAAYPRSIEGGASRGAYVVADPADGAPEVIIIATGSEVSVALGAYAELANDGVKARVVSMPSFEIFEEQSPDYKESVLPSTVLARVSVEAGATLGWGRYVGTFGVSIGLDRFGASAPAKTNFEKFGFTSANVAAKARGLLNGKKACC